VKNSKGSMIQDGGVYPANSGVRKGPWGEGKVITADSPQFNPVIKGPVIAPAGAGNLNTAGNTKASRADGDL